MQLDNWVSQHFRDTDVVDQNGELIRRGCGYVPGRLRPHKIWETNRPGIVYKAVKAFDGVLKDKKKAALLRRVNRKIKGEYVPRTQDMHRQREESVLLLIKEELRHMDVRTFNVVADAHADPDTGRITFIYPGWLQLFGEREVLLFARRGERAAAEITNLRWHFVRWDWYINEQGQRIALRAQIVLLKGLFVFLGLWNKAKKAQEAARRDHAKALRAIETERNRREKAARDKAEQQRKAEQREKSQALVEQVGGRPSRNPADLPDDAGGGGPPATS